MNYATKIDFAKFFSDREALNLTDVDGAGEVNLDVLNNALSEASQEVDSYIGVRYPLPLPDVPSVVKRATCDIARYRLYKDRPTDEVKERFKSTVAWLKDVSNGVAVLMFENPPPTPIVTTPNYVKPAVAATPAVSVFSDKVLGKMPDFCPNKGVF